MIEPVRTYSCRSVTAEEIEHYQQYGWVKLEGLIAPETVAALLDFAKRKLGFNGEENTLREGRFGHDYFNMDLCRGFEIDWLSPLLRSMARNAKVLMDRGDDTQIRYMHDTVATKLPASKQERHSGTSRTDLHQDYPSSPVDRAGGMMFWVALVDLLPEAGTMDFLNGSHRKGPLGAHFTHKGRDLTDFYPRLLQECPSSGPIAYKAGDATVHHNLCVHGAGQNLTDQPRWSYIVGWHPADACWTGAPPRSPQDNKYEGMKPFQQLNDVHFPIMSD